MTKDAKSSLAALLLVIAMTGMLFLSACRHQTGSPSDEKLPQLEETGVTLTTELRYYAEGTTMVLAFWENNTEYNITFGEPFVLERYDASRGRWVDLTQRDGVGFILPAYTLDVGWRTKHTYNIGMFCENITEGRYRIRTSYSCICRDEDIGIAAEFFVTRDMSLVEASELDFSERAISRELRIWHIDDEAKGRSDFPVRVWKNRYTFDTTIVVNGRDYYMNIAQGVGGWGIVQGIFVLRQNGSVYLLYSFSRQGQSGERLSYIGIFDLDTREEIFRSEPFALYDISVNYRGNGVFHAGFMEHFEDFEGGFGSSWVSDIGYFKVSNSEIVFLE
ncbi:MAG: hypothetical protein FWE06_06290 [Oscillospiraceae bacterium]|nr:hypothetical protein [Oscillospiraceae bacterium]